MEKIYALAKAAKVRPEWLLTGEPPMPAFDDRSPIPTMVENFSRRLGWALGDESPVDLEARTSYPADRVIRLLHEDEAPGEMDFHRLGHYLHVRPAWLLTGEEPIRSDEIPDNDVSGRIHGLPHAVASDVSHGIHSVAPISADDYWLIPRVDVRAAAGDAVLIPGDEIVDWVLFRTDYLRHELGLDPRHLTVIQAKGDSMEPTIQSGDLLLVDLSQAHDADNAIYVLNVDGRLLVKRLAFRLDGTIRVLSDNPKYEAEVVKREDAEAFRLVGRVVWSGGRV